MFKYKLNHNIDEQTCLSYYLVHTHRFSSHSNKSGLYCMTLRILYYVIRKGWKLAAGRSWATAKLKRNLPIKYYQTHRSSSNAIAIRSYVYSTVPTGKMPPPLFSMKTYTDWKSFRTGLSRSALTPIARNLNIPNFVTAPHAKIIPHNSPDLKFYIDLNDRPRDSLVIFDTIFFKVGGWCQGRSTQACAEWPSISVFLHRKKRGDILQVGTVE